MLSYRMSTSQTEAFDRGGHAATEIATAIADTLRVMTEETVVVVDTKGIIAFVVEASGGTA
jgi:hypothetical protein